MVWVLAFVVSGFAGFLFDVEIARHIPFASVVVRHTAIGAMIGLATGFSIHTFEQLR